MPATELPNTKIASVTCNTTAEIIRVNQAHQLSENIFALIHAHKLTWQNQFKSFKSKNLYKKLNINLLQRIQNSLTGHY